MLKNCFLTDNFHNLTLQDCILKIHSNYSMSNHHHPTWIHGKLIVKSRKLRMHWNLFTFVSCYLKLSTNNLMQNHHQLIIVNHKQTASERISTTQYKNSMRKCNLSTTYQYKFIPMRFTFIIKSYYSTGKLCFSKMILDKLMQICRVRIIC